MTTTRDTSGEDEVLRWAAEYAREHGWVLNPDGRVLAIVVSGLARNEKRFGARYCPCRIRSGDEERDRAIICPCIYHRDEIERDGHCHCRLYYRKDATVTRPGTDEMDDSHQGEMNV